VTTSANEVVLLERKINLRYSDFETYFGIKEGYARWLVNRGILPKPFKPNGPRGIALFDRREVVTALSKAGLIKCALQEPLCTK
jgi:hypothetical protein